MDTLSQEIDEIRNNLLIWIEIITKNGFWAIQIPDSPPDYRTLSKDKVRLLLFFNGKHEYFSRNENFECNPKCIRIILLLAGKQSAHPSVPRCSAASGHLHGHRSSV